MASSMDLLALKEVVGLSSRERQIVHGLLSGLSASEAARAAGYAESTVRRKSGMIARRGPIRSAIAAVMSATGITPEVLVQTMADGLNASTAAGLPDHYARHRFLETALRIGGHEPSRESFDESYEERVFRLRGLPW